MPRKSKFLIVIAGPTGIGKSAASLTLASALACPILSADSRQMYRQMSIGTAKPSVAERGSIPHYFIDTLDIEQSYSAGQFERDALDILDSVYNEHRYAILAGGTGLYVQAVLEGLDAFPDVPEHISAKWQQLYESKGIAHLQASLQERDPDYFVEVDIHNARRLIRALSVIDASGKTFSHFRTGQLRSRSFTPIRILLDMERTQLYVRINERVDRMIEAGLVEEARSLFPHRDQLSLQTVGYREIFAWMDGERSLEEAVEEIKKNTRRYAKRQMTWFRNRSEWKHFAPEDIVGMQAYIDQQTTERSSTYDV